MFKNLVVNLCFIIQSFPLNAIFCFFSTKVFNFSNYFSSFTWLSFINSLPSISDLASIDVVSTSLPFMLPRTWGSYLKKNQQSIFNNQIDGRINLNTLCEFNCVHYFVGMMIKDKLEEENTLELIGCGICWKEIPWIEAYYAFLWIWEMMFQLLSYYFAPSKI